jgi:ankyrin repeat protein
MRELFKAIRHSNFEKVKSIIEENNALINCTSKQPPKKDDGQSPLQVAYKTGNFDIADYLVNLGANVNFIETESINEWTAPVIHDAIRASVFSSRYYASGKMQNNKETFEKAISSLRSLINAGANVKAVDSYGNNSLMRAAADANQLNLKENAKELIEDLKKVFILLISSGADINESNDRRKSAAQQFSDMPVALFFKS